MAEKKKSRKKGRPLGSGVLVKVLPEPRVFNRNDLEELRKKLAEITGLERSLSQADLARLLGSTRASVRSWEAGTTKPSKATRRLLEILLLAPCAATLLINENGMWRKLLQQYANSSALKSESTNENDEIE